MKAVSTIMATILMLVITIALAAVAFAYMYGLIGTKLAVILSIDPASTQCSGTAITMYVKNEGTASATVTGYTADIPGGTAGTACGAA